MAGQRGETQSYMRLNDAFRAEFDWSVLKKQRDAFVDWARKEWKTPTLVRPNDWKPLRDGEPVRKSVVEAFAVYCDEKLKIRRDWRLGTIAEPAEPPTQERLPPAWRGPGDFRQVLAFLSRRFRARPEAFCNDEADLAFATHIIFRCAGVGHNPSLAGRAADEEGARVLKRSQEEYRRMLTMFWHRNEHTVVFATCREGGEWRRVGVSVVTPLTKSAYIRLRSGDVEDCDLTLEDVALKSKYMMIAAAADNRVDLKATDNSGARGRAMLNGLLFQTAMVSPPRETDKPQLLTFEGIPEVRNRVAKYGFVPTGTSTPLTGMAIHEYGPPKGDRQDQARLLAAAQYQAFQMILPFYRNANEGPGEED